MNEHEEISRGGIVTTSDRRFLLLVWFMLLTGVGISAWEGFSFVHQAQQRSALRHDSRLVAGVITRLHSIRGARYMVHYRFEVNGATYSGVAELRGSDITLHKSDQIFVRFLPSDPSVNHPAAWEWSWLTELDSMIWGIFFVAIGIFTLRYLKRKQVGRKSAAPSAM